MVGGKKTEKEASLTSEEQEQWEREKGPWGVDIAGKMQPKKKDPSIPNKSISWKRRSTDLPPRLIRLNPLVLVAQLSLYFIYVTTLYSRGYFRLHSAMLFACFYNYEKN